MEQQALVLGQDCVQLFIGAGRQQHGAGNYLLRLSRLALALPNSIPLPKDCLTYSPKRSRSNGSPAKDLQPRQNLCTHDKLMSCAGCEAEL